MNEKKSTLKVIVFLLIFAILAVGITFVLIKLKTTNRQEIVVANETTKINQPNISNDSTEKNVDTIQVNDLFTINNIKLKMQLYENGDSWQQDKYNYITEQREYITRKYEEVHYIQIDGLKDKTVQNNINKKIEELAKGMLVYKENDGILIYTKVKANFNNILTIAFYQRSYSKSGIRNIYDDYTYFTEWNATTQYLNLDLSTGNEIKFEDVFIDGADIKNMVAESLFDHFITKFGSEGGPAYTYNYNSHTKGWGDDLETYYPLEIDCFGTEDKVFEAMNEFNKEKNHLFYITEGGDVYIPFGTDKEENVKIALKKHYSKFNYKNFSSSGDIYDGKYNENLKVWAVNTSIYCNYITPNFLLITDRDGARYLLNCLDSNEEQEIFKEHVKRAEDIFKYEKEYANNNLDKMNILMFDCCWDEGATFNYYNSVPYPIKVALTKENFEEEKFLQEVLKEINEEQPSGIFSLGKVATALDKYEELFPNEANDKNYFNSYNNKYNHTYIREMLAKYYQVDNIWDVRMTGDYILPSNTQILDKSGLECLTEEELNILRNELFARYGHDFKTAWLKEVFYKYNWYPITYGKSVSTQELNETEKENLKIIDEVIAGKSN